ATAWEPWAKEERLRRQTIRIYSKLFTLKQQLEGGIVETQIELVWGIGVGIWKYDGRLVQYPVIGQLVEMSLDPETAEIEIRQRDVDPSIEIDWYASVENPGVADLEDAAKQFFGRADATSFSPFERSTFEHLLRRAVANLDANGVYWPNEVPPEDRNLPTSDDHLKITDTWVLFARPRTTNILIQDLEKFKKQAEEADEYPPPVAAIVTDPDDSNTISERPRFRGVSTSYHSDAAGSDVARDLYFPKPFNAEQQSIVELLEVSDGVVVQGPPGTGKTHTIANVICHYMAEGKRVLVTSMKDPALAVLQAMLPEELQPLVISLLTSERDGMKQFEHAIRKIASEVPSIDRPSTEREIAHIQESIDALHGKLARTDRRIADWAKRNLTKIALETEEIDPQDAAREVVENTGQFEWIPDDLEATPDFAPRFSDQDVARLRDARRILGPDIDYLDAKLPQLAEFPDSKLLLEVHQDLSQFQILQRQVEGGEVPALADSSQETLSLARQLLAQIETLRRLREEVAQADCTWAVPMHKRLRGTGAELLLSMLEAVGAELRRAIEARTVFLERPVAAPEGVELDDELCSAVGHLAEGKSPFGLIGLFGKSAQKSQLESIRVLGNPPDEPESWAHVGEYLASRRTLRELAIRWNTLASELPLDSVPEEPEGGLTAAEGFEIYLKVKAVTEVEHGLQPAVSAVFPNWSHASEVADSTQRLSELESALQHHITRDRLANVWSSREGFQTLLDGRSGRVVGKIQDFLNEVLGNPDVSDVEMQAAWSALMSELSRVLGLEGHLATVREVTDEVAASGAPKYAHLLRQPLDGTTDSLLPNSWQQSWRLRRLATHLESIDAHQELRKLGQERRQTEADLSMAYQDAVVKRTWLKLAENASTNVLAALQAYLNAISHIGKTGRGKRAVRNRQAARMAAADANPAVPCWIMPHYRVSESLPAELGCFDLVVIDEASQSDFSALPALLRAKKVLIVGDDKQVSPEAVGIKVEKEQDLMDRFLGDQVPIFRDQMAPANSIYDLFKVVFAGSTVMLKEHFRCAPPIIEYSKREFYNHELRPLRLPTASERLDPPLVDILIDDGYRKGDENRPEARFIVDEIKAIVEDPGMSERTIGVVSLLGYKQALAIWNQLTDELGPEIMQRHHILCGDARTFQGNERDIIFLSMVSAPNEESIHALSGRMYDQRFNVAASRAKDRMYLVRSVESNELSEKDQLRRGLIAHFKTPFELDQARVDDLRSLCESDFEREMYDELTKRGYWVTPQVHVGRYRIDMVVEGHNDRRLAVECDGDRYHGPEKWADDMQRQRVLERAGWVFWRCFGAAFYRRRSEVLEDLVATLAERGIEPIGAEGAPPSVHTEHRAVSAMSDPAEVLDGSDAEDPTDSASTESSEVSPVQPDEPADTASIDDVQQVQSDEGAPSLSGAEPEDSEPTVSGDQDTPPEPGRRLEGSAARRADLLRTVRAISSASEDEASGNGEQNPNESEPEERDDAER
ncbi:MAG: AAA family ATPase, partial [Chloroflexi bacterium]|nr:AAA family ATPase [Chloroflexota bacterium]